MKEWVAVITYDTGIKPTPDEAGRETGSSLTEVEFQLDDPSQILDLLYHGPNKLTVDNIFIRRSNTERFPTTSIIDLHDQMIEEDRSRQFRDVHRAPIRRKEHG